MGPNLLTCCLQVVAFILFLNPLSNTLSAFEISSESFTQEPSGSIKDINTITRTEVTNLRQLLTADHLISLSQSHRPQIRTRHSPFRVDLAGRIHLTTNRLGEDTLPPHRPDFSSFFAILPVGSLMEFSDDSLFATTAALHTPVNQERLQTEQIAASTTFPSRNLGIGFVMLLSIVMFSGLVFWGWISNKHHSEITRR